jgi:hypothetical protein
MSAATEGFDETTTAATIKLKPIPDDLEALGRYGLMVPFIEEWCRAVTGRIDKVAVEQGRKVPGFKVVIGKAGSRFWRDASGAEQELGELPLAKTHTEPVPPKLKSPAQIEAVVGKAKMKATFAQFVGQEPGRKTVVPVSDKRPEVAHNAADGFSSDDDGGDLT